MKLVAALRRDKDPQKVALHSREVVKRAFYRQGKAANVGVQDGFEEQE